VEAALLEAVDAIRPALQADGGDMRVLEINEDAGSVDIELVGACVGCPMSTMTLKAGIERILKDRVPGLNEVRAKGIDFDVDPAMGGFDDDEDW
jgi:Fe-S cluster biogenesis protein NfuA